MGWINKDGRRKILEKINEHHHVVMFAWAKKIGSFPIFSKDFNFRLLWHEVSQGTYCVVLKTLEKQKSEMLKIKVLSTILIEPCLDGKSCIASFSSRMTWQ